MSSEVSDTESLPAADETEISDNNTAIGLKQMYSFLF